MTEAQLRELQTYRESEAFSPLEKLVLDDAVAMTLTPVEVSSDLFTALRAHFDEGQLVELTTAVAWENYRARFDHALGVEAQGFSEGAYCVLAERAAKETPAR